MMTAMEAPIPADQLMIVPANEAPWDDLAAIFGTTDYPGRCQCQRFKVLGWIWRDSTQEERTAMLRAQTACGDPNATATSGLVAYLDDEPVGWVAVEPRTAYAKLRTSRVPWSGRDEDKGDDGIWAVTCFVIRKGYRGRGLTYPLARATIDFARARGARALEAYPMITEPAKEITWGEAHVGARQVFEDAGFEEVSRPTVRRVVMRIDFEQRGVASHDHRIEGLVLSSGHPSQRHPHPPMLADGHSVHRPPQAHFPFCRCERGFAAGQRRAAGAPVTSALDRVVGWA